MTGIVVLNYNNTTDIIVCIKSIIKHLELSTIKIVVVENGSKVCVSETVGRALSELFPSSFVTLNADEVLDVHDLPTMTYIISDINVGYARGNNIGIKALIQDDAISEILVLNSDIILTENILPPLLSVLNGMKDLGAVSPILRRPDGAIDYCCARKSLKKKDLLLTFSILYNERYGSALEERKMLKSNPELITQRFVHIDLPSGSCMLFKKTVLEALGGFDEGTFLYYEEDILYKKLKSMGLTNILVPSVSCIHLGGATTNSTKSAYFLKKCNYESLLYYLKKYESCTNYEIIYFKLTASIRLFRLWLGMIYHKIIH